MARARAQSLSMNLNYITGEESPLKESYKATEKTPSEQLRVL